MTESRLKISMLIFDISGEISSKKKSRFSVSMVDSDVQN